ncbi:MAG TPA: tetratricopeptide repeat protein [Anaerolineales bacterium]|nr:tetratricopeptide repeat protein [Anaerolineales bacterium]
MNSRKILAFLVSIWLVLLFSYLYRQWKFEDNNSFDVREINRDALAALPFTSTSIQLFQDRLQHNPEDVVSYTVLGQLYLRQARETGDVASYLKAETAFQLALDFVPDYTLAEISLASAYYAEHRFFEALEIAQEVYRKNPKDIQALALIGDSNLALGRYPEAELAYQELEMLSATPPILVRLAHFAELKGETEKALELMERAIKDAVNIGLAQEEIAWYLIRTGEICFNAGDLSQAEKYYETAARIYPHYYLGYASLGKLRAAQGDYEAAIENYEQSLAIVPQPDFLAVLGDLYTLTGNAPKAQIQYDTVEFIGKLAIVNAQIYNRQLAYFYTDHDIRLDEALTLSAGELEYRADVQGYDVAAWASYKMGFYDQAEDWITQALKLGTRDAKFYYHAGMIALAQGKTTQARDYLTEALAINPYFDPIQGQTAHTTLEQLQEVALP